MYGFERHAQSNCADGFNFFSAIVGATSVVMVIAGGFRYIISGGNPDAVRSARNSILYAVVGLVIVVMVQVVVRFILDKQAHRPRR